MASPGTNSDLIVVGDVGGTNCRTAVVGPEGLVCEPDIVPTPHDPGELFQLLGSRILYLADRYGAATGALGMPGPIKRRAGTVAVGPFKNIAGVNEPFDLEEQLAAEHPKLSGFPVLPLNDAEAGAVAAARLYAVNDNEEPLTYLTVSTGVGGDTCIGYESISYTTGIPSEYGHIPLFETPGGNSVTLEDRLSGKAITKQFDSHPTEQDWQIIGQGIARGIGVLIPILGMAQVVIGGGVGGNHNHQFGESLATRLDEIMQAMPDNFVRPEVSYVPKPRDPDMPDMVKDIGLFGCYYAAIQRNAA